MGGAGREETGFYLDIAVEMGLTADSSVSTQEAEGKKQISLQSLDRCSWVDRKQQNRI